MKHKILFTLIVLGFLPHLAYAESKQFKLGNRVNVTPVSGYASVYKEMGENNPYLAIKGLEWGEKSDDPCAARVISQHLNGHAETELVLGENVNDYVWGGLVKGAYGNIKLGCSGNGKKAAALSYGQYVYKVRVCTTDKRNTSKNKLKGIRFWFRTPENDGYKDGDKVKLIDQASYQQAIHKPHCDKWHKPVSCGKGEVAAKVRLHYHSNTNNPSLSGIALVCKKVKFNPQKHTPSSVTDEKVPTQHKNQF